MKLFNIRKLCSAITSVVVVTTSLLQTAVYANYEQKDDTGQYHLTFKNSPV
jgi:hypothetical protein